MFKTAVTKIAHNSTLPSLAGNRDLRPLQDLITAEKAVLISIQKLSADFSRAAEALKSWGVCEGEDLADILSSSSAMLELFSGALTQYSAHEQTIRDHMKAVRTREEQLDELRKHRKAVGNRTESAEKKLSRMGSEHKNLAMQTDLLAQLKDQIRTLDTEIITEEAAIGDFKRRTTREWMALKFGGLVECTEKGTIIGELGKLLIAEIPEDETRPGLPRVYYQGHEKTQSLVTEAQRCVNGVAFTSVPSMERTPSFQSPSLASKLSPGGDAQRAERSNLSMVATDGGTGPFPAPQYLSTPSGLSGQGLGHFLNPSDAPSTQTNFDSETATVGQSREPSQAYSVDDMGVTGPVQGKDSGTSSWAKSGGGRFATFPVKTSGVGRGIGRGVSLTDDGPSSTRIGENGAESQRKEPSFELEVTQALFERSQAPGAQLPASYQQDSGDTVGGWLQSTPYAGSGDVGGSSRVGAAPELAGDSMKNPWGDNASSHRRNESDLSAQLAYTADSDEVHDERISRHVRFGGVSDVDEEMARRTNVPSSLPTQQVDTSDARERGQRGPVPAPLEPDSMFQSPSRVPVPAATPTMFHNQGWQEPINEEDEKARNMAAARDVTHEMSLSPPASPPTSSSAHSYQPPPSPLAPPAPLFARRAVSPTASLENLQKFSASEMSPISRSSGENIPFLGSPPLSSSGPTASPFTMSGARSVSSSSSPLSPYRIGGETDATSRSMSSLNSPPAPASGARTIAAAAFKRNTGRNASGSLSEPGAPAPGGRGGADGGIADTVVTPLSVKKRALPTSPYPERGHPQVPGGADAPVPRGDASMTMSPPVMAGGRDGAEDDDQFDYIAAYVSSVGGTSPLMSPALGEQTEQQQQQNARVGRALNDDPPRHDAVAAWNDGSLR